MHVKDIERKHRPLPPLLRFDQAHIVLLTEQKDRPINRPYSNTIPKKI